MITIPDPPADPPVGFEGPPTPPPPPPLLVVPAVDPLGLLFCPPP